MVRDSEFSDSDLLRMIQSDSVGRNQYLNSFIESLNSVTKNTYISLDGDWGSGKTVFMKQLEYLSRCDSSQLSAQSISNDTVEAFQEKYTVFYYNSWENDRHDDPLQSLLLSLIEKFYTGQVQEDKVNKLVENTFRTVVKEGIKTLTSGLVDIDKISEVETMEQLVSDVTAVNKRKEAISEIINAILPEGKKLLFIIDELDRCNPEFAVRLLEVTKHYYNDDNMIFTLSTNNRQLAQTVKKYYGSEFDGYGYLDKLYDLPLELPPVDMKQYFTRQLRVVQNGFFVNTIPTEIALRLRMSMREANRYSSLISFIRGGLSHTAESYQDTDISYTCFLFIPLALALRIRNIEMYDQFISGDGADILKTLFSDSSDVSNLVRTPPPDNIQPIDIIVERYQAVINASNLPYDRASAHTREASEYLKKTLPLMNSIGNIDE